MTILCCS